MVHRENGFANVIGFDDAPFERTHLGKVPVVGTVYADLRLDGVLIGAVEKDGTDAAATLADLVHQSRFAEHVQMLMLQGITMAGFNVVDVFLLHRELGIPVLVVARRQPDFASIRKALMEHIEGGRQKWDIIEALGPMEPIGPIYVQRVGLNIDQAAAVIDRFACNGHIPEPLRTAHLIAGAHVTGHSRGNP